MGKPVLFIDFNGVLSYKNFWFSLENGNEEEKRLVAKLDVFLFKDNKQLVREWMVGKYTSEDIHRLIERELGIKYEYLWPVFVRDCVEIDVSSSVIEKIKLLKEKYFVFLRTDNMDCFDRFTLPHHPELLCFDQIDNSYTLKELKNDNDGAYFASVAKKFGSPLVECILVDDSKSTCALFSALEGKAFCTKNEQEVLGVLEKIG